MVRRSWRCSNVLVLLLAVGLLRSSQWAALVSTEIRGPEICSPSSTRPVNVVSNGANVWKCRHAQSAPFLHGCREALSLRRNSAGKRSSSPCTRHGFYRAVANFARNLRRVGDRVDAVLERTPLRRRAPWSDLNKEAYEEALSSQEEEVMEDYLYEFLNAALTHRPAISETQLEALAKELLEADAQWEDMLISLKKLVPISGRWASCSEAGYASISALNSDFEMRHFIRHTAYSMRMEITDCTSNGLDSLVPLHCGTASTKSFEVLCQELRDEAAIGKWLRAKPISHIAVAEEVHLTSGGVPFPGACPRCEGRGFVHYSSLRHDKAADERCLFCKDCIACDGTGLAQGPMCLACQGRGFIHESTIAHDQAENVRCFFCSNCKECKGLGYLRKS